ncbi:MAG: GIN domain-containing protein [Bacteroidia bacterium]
MFRKAFTYVLFAGGFLLFNSCRKQNMCDCFKPRGETKIETRQLKDFGTLQVFDKINVYYTQDTTITVPTAQVVTGKNLISSVTTEVINGSLEIRNLNKCNFMRGEHNDITVYITSPKTKVFYQEGVGDLFFTNNLVADTVSLYLRNSGDVHMKVNTSYVDSHMHGVGDVYIEGHTTGSYFYCIGQGFIHAENLYADNTYILYGSNGIAKIRVSADLNAVLTSTGNVYYGGNPPLIQKTITGKGSLIAD